MALTKITNVREIFIHVFSDFKELILLVEYADTLPQLTPVQSKKLKHLTIVSLAAKCKVSA